MNTAVIGLGIGLAHVAGYLKSNQAALKYVCDLQPERLTRLGGTFEQGSFKVLERLFTAKEKSAPWENLGVRGTTDLGEILADDSVELVSLCTPDYTHYELALRCLEAGKHLLLEKPLALEKEKAEEILKQAESRGLRISVGYEFRINPAVMRLRSLVESGELGDIQAFALYHYRTPFRRDKWNKWIQKKEYSGGLLIEETCHWFDLAEYVTGKEIGSIFAVGSDKIHPDFDYEDIAFCQGSYSDGGVYQISHALSGFDFSLVLQLHGTAGSAWCGLKEEPYSSLDAGTSDYLGVVSSGPLNASPDEATVNTYGWEATEPENIREYTIHTVDRLQDGGEFLSGGKAGMRSLQVALAARRSLDAGTPVEF